MLWAFNSGDAEKMHRARDEFLKALRFHGAKDIDYPACELIFAELVGNVARHAPGLVRVLLERKADTAVLHVVDHGPVFRLKPSLPRNIFQTDGRGLFLVSALAKSLNVTPLDERGKIVSAVLPVRMPHRKKASWRFGRPPER
jgi:anti-sigma regulatory factor (Ser/Thr protein kinase)